MANIPRSLIIEDGSCFHVTWQCHNKDWLLQNDWAKSIYYQLLLRYKDRYRISFYSYCFMSNHPHLTGYCESLKLFSDFFRVVNSCFAKEINKQLGRRGQVVMDRFKSPRIETERDLFRVMRYIDLNPKRAGMVEHPREYKWSSFHYYAYGKEDQLITPPECYLELGNTDEERQRAYRELVEEVLENNWREKKNYSLVAYIGSPHWVLEKSYELRKYQQIKQSKWKKSIEVLKAQSKIE